MINFKKLLETTDKPIGKGAQDFAKKAAKYGEKLEPFIGSDEVMQAFKGRPLTKSVNFKAKVDHGTTKDKTKIASYEDGKDKQIYENLNPALSAVLNEDVALFTEFVESALTQRVLDEVRIKTNRADKKAVIVHAVDPETGQSKTFTKKAATGEINISEDKDPCWDGYKQLGVKKKNGKDVPNCIKEDDLTETFKPGSISLQDKSTVTISKEDAMTLNMLYGTLSDNNKAKMDSKLRKNKTGYSEILAFAKTAV